jgi:chromosome segregation ATPase
MNTNKRVSSIGDKLIAIKSNISKLSQLEDEKNYLNKLDITENNIANILEHKKTLTSRDIEAKQRTAEIINNNLEQITKENNSLTDKLIKLDKQHEELRAEFNKCSEIKKKYFNDIVKIRKDNTKELDNKIYVLSNQEKECKKLQNELFLILNMIKLRIVNTDTASEEKSYKGYIIDVNNNRLKYIDVNKREDANRSAVKYWQAMKEILLDK